ncbi:EamA family transporter [Candidatus Woesearchaeota archaeon]|nr:EamA family transporter [Candidatus Woesearchaeota archaeon]
MKTKTLAILLILFTTFFTSSAQISLKFGVNKLKPSILGLVSNYYLVLGFLLYAIAGILAIMAFRKGQVSVLYPIFATSYIWVSLLSAYFFREDLSMLKWLGIFVIIAGISLVGFGDSKLKASGEE